MHARSLLLVCLALTPTAGGLTVELAAPEAVPLDGVPVAANVTLRDAGGPVELKAWLGGEGWQASRTWNGTAFQRSDHYAVTVDPGPDGRWSGRVWVQPNPDSANADRWRATDERLLGVRARAEDARADVHASVDALRMENRSWAATGPDRPVAVHRGGEQLGLLGSPAGRKAIAVPDPSQDRQICGPASCAPDPAWRLTRVGEDAIELAPDEGRQAGVLLMDGQACPLPAPEGGEARRIAWESLREEGGCAKARPNPLAARHLHRGQAVAEAPETPGRGEIVRDPVGGGWAPWRMPEGIEPQPVPTVPVEGQARVFATAEEGLDVLAQALSQARERVTVTSYLLTSQPVTDLLARTADRGVDVHLWLEPDPVGGQPDVTADRVQRLEAHGVHVHEAAGPSEAGLQHAKIVVVDSTLLLVLTENLTEHGFPSGGEANMGLGVGIVNASLAGRVESIFRDPGQSRAIAMDGWEPFDAPVTVLKAPENAWREQGVPAWLDEAEGPVEGAVLRANPRWGPRANAWLAGLVEQSRQASVELTFSGAPEGAARSNREALAHLQAHPDAGRLSGELSDPRAGTLHAKTIVTSEGLLVGSSNWGLGGALLNREVNLIVHDPRLAEEARSIVDGWDESPRLSPDVPMPAHVPASRVSAGLACAVAAVLSSTLGAGRWRRR